MTQQGNIYDLTGERWVDQPDTAPADLLWVLPGTDAPRLYRCTPVRPSAAEMFSAASTAAVIFAAGWVAGLLTMIFILRGTI